MSYYNRVMSEVFAVSSAAQQVHDSAMLAGYAVNQWSMDDLNRHLELLEDRVRIMRAKVAAMESRGEKIIWREVFGA